MISVYVLQCGLDDSQKDDFYDRLINVVKKLGEKKLKGLLSFVLL